MIKQFKQVPAFRGSCPGQHLRCKNCQDSTLIEEFHTDQFIGVEILCSVCGYITKTPGLDPGEILPSKILVLERNLDRVMTETFVLEQGYSVTQDAEAAYEQITVAPNEQNQSLTFNQTPEVLDFLKREHDHISPGSIQKQTRSMDRFITQKNIKGAVSKLPFIWSINHAQRMLPQLKLNKVVTRPIDAVALTNLEVFFHFIVLLGRHVDIKVFANDLTTGDGFHHAMGVFACLWIFHTRGYRVALAHPNSAGRTADLYVRPEFGIKQFIEVKVPNSMRYPACMRLSPDIIETVVVKSLRDSKKQLSSVNRGILVLYITFLLHEIAPKIRDGLARAVNKVGDRYRGVSGILIIFPKLEEAVHSSRGIADFSFGYVFARNSHFEGKDVFTQIFPSGSDSVFSTPSGL